MFSGLFRYIGKSSQIVLKKDKLHIINVVRLDFIKLFR